MIFYVLIRYLIFVTKFYSLSYIINLFLFKYVTRSFTYYYSYLS